MPGDGGRVEDRKTGTNIIDKLKKIYTYLFYIEWLCWIKYKQIEINIMRSLGYVRLDPVWLSLASLGEGGLKICLFELRKLQ